MYRYQRRDKVWWMFRCTVVARARPLHQRTDPLGLSTEGGSTGSSGSKRTQASTKVFEKPLPDRFLGSGTADLGQ